VPGFNLPVVLGSGNNRFKIIPSQQWQSTPLNEEQSLLLTRATIEKMYYVSAEIIQEEK
jgi:hypothetical protein